MQENDPQNVAFYYSTLFVRSLYEQGVRHAVLSPGSRSTALTLAFASHPGIHSRVIIDERSAAFTALGIAKSTGIPAVLVCTSGTAVANYYPAVIEAAQSGTPLIVASADRPPHTRGIGASQTIDQLKIFGNYPIFFHEADEPSASNVKQKRLQVSAAQAVQNAIYKSGVAHINLPFSKPFEPEESFLQHIESENKKHANSDYASYSTNVGIQKMGETFWSDLVSAEKPLIVVGPAPLKEDLSFIEILAKVLKAPVLAEPGSGVKNSKYNIQGFDGFLRSEENQSILQADLILRFGFQPVSKAVNDYLEKNNALQICFISNSNWNDGSLSAERQVWLRAPLSIPDVTGSATDQWLKTWKKAEKAYKKFREKLLAPSTPLTDGYVFSKISGCLSQKSFSMLSNSFPVRDMSMFGKYGDQKIFVNRGAAGIDGITSTAMGLSMGMQKPGVLFTGDIAFLHDINALLNAASLDEPLVVIVLNNGGGTIFRMLPVYSVKKMYSRYFETPQSANIAALCRAYKVDHAVISRPEQLIPAFDEMISHKGLHVMECVTDADQSMEQRRQLWEFSIT